MPENTTGNTRHRAEKLVGSFSFSVFCFAIWGGLTAWRARESASDFTFIRIVWLVYNSVIAVLFLVRTRPTVVSLNPVHWLVALLASFSGLFFETESHGIPYLNSVGDCLILLGVAVSGSTAVALRRSYDFLPALRGVTTDWLYRCVRHPMYLSSIVIRFSYLLKHASAQNGIVFAIIIWLYVKRLNYEEAVMQTDERYVAYMQRVRHRLLPGLY